MQFRNARTHIRLWRDRKSELRPGPSASGAIWNHIGSLCPDQEVPENLDNLPDRIDFIARLCGAWDFGVMPYPDVLNEILKKEWCEAVAETNLLTSCAYHLLRELHRLEPAPYFGPKFPHILDDPCLSMV
ncbi:MAG: hypothetical protein MUC94_05550 [bacterium]|jgi:hypothetical protein|nr:hypothetical protein [bacterium]